MIISKTDVQQSNFRFVPKFTSAIISWSSHPSDWDRIPFSPCIRRPRMCSRCIWRIRLSSNSSRWIEVEPDGRANDRVRRFRANYRSCYRVTLPKIPDVAAFESRAPESVIHITYGFGTVRYPCSHRQIIPICLIARTEANVTKNSIRMIVILMLAIGSIATPARAQNKPDCARVAFPLILGVGYWVNREAQVR